jgi:hypothetical protein
MGHVWYVVPQDERGGPPRVIAMECQDDAGDSLAHGWKSHGAPFSFHERHTAPKFATAIDLQ